MSDSSHHCDTALVSCIDWRLDRGGTLRAEMKRVFGSEAYDLIALPGGAKNLVLPKFWNPLALCRALWVRRLALSYLSLAMRLHGVRRIILAVHTDCGAYGAIGTRERLVADLRTAERFVRRKLGWDGSEVELALARISARGEEWEVSLEALPAAEWETL
jgi:carbonic anhydrase